MDASKIVKKRMLFLAVILHFYALIRAGSSEDAQEESNLMRFMWMTPIQSLQLDKITSSKITANKILEDLTQATSNYFQEYSQQQETIDKAATMSDGFYLHQQRASLEYKKCIIVHQDWKKNCAHYLPPAMQQLTAIIQTILFNYLQDSMVQESPLFRILQNPFESEKALFVWTSIHQNGSHHAPHHHQNSAVSGVLYVQVPKGAGDIVFYDPRGALPPFGKTLHIQPAQGKIVLFPSWLLHGVEPTTSMEQRISISFNIDGEWEATTDINTAFITS